MTRKGISRSCDYCGKTFDAARPGAKYCSNACRTKAYRKRHGLPFPDFSKLITTRMPTEKEHRLMMLNDELNNIMLEEKGITKNYKQMLERYEHALKTYEANPSTWSSEFATRRKIEFDEVRNLLLDKQINRVKLEKQVRELNMIIDREELENKNLIMSADEIRNLKFNVIELGKPWRQFLGRPSVNFHMIIYGPAKSGKSTFALKFAKHLRTFGSLVYIAVYEKISFSIQNKIIKYDISGIDFSRANNKKEINYVINKGKYDFVIIDGAGHAYLNVNDIDQMKQHNPNTSFITIFQVSEDDGMKISDKLKQRSDIIVKVENGVAISQGRYVYRGEYQIFDEEDKAGNGK